MSASAAPFGPEAQPSQWQVHVDAGGTFTDLIVIAPPASAPDERAAPVVLKVLSGPGAVTRGLTQLWGSRTTWPPLRVRMGTTAGTNALLERRGSALAWVTNRGFGDMLHIGDQTRPDLFARVPELDLPLHRYTVQVDARSDAQGGELCPVDAPRTLHDLRRAFEQGARALAITLLHAHTAPEHERQIARLARKVGFTHVSCSHEVAHAAGWLARAETTVVDAYLSPVLRKATGSVAAQLAARCELPPEFWFMQSNGGLVPPDAFRGRDCVMSGPAGGVIALARIAEALQLPAVIGFDMGGTSTDVSRYAGRFERSFSSRVAGLHVRVPMLEVHTVAAGGGSIFEANHGALQVGPESAGSDPGPLCYGHAEASALTVSDLNLHLGRIATHHFPFPLDPVPVRAALESLDASFDTPLGIDRLAAGGIEIANAHMADAVRELTLARGHDPRAHALVAFGGAGGQHACALAQRLGITRVVHPPFAGVLSAWGIGQAQHSWHAQRDVGALRLPLARTRDAVPETAEVCETIERALLQLDIELEAKVPEPRYDQRSAVKGSTHSTPSSQLRIQNEFSLAYRGTHEGLPIEMPERVAGQPIHIDAGELLKVRARFEALHLERFGYLRQDQAIEVRSVHAQLSVIEAQQAGPSSGAQPEAAFPPRDEARLHRCYSNGAWHELPLVERADLCAGQALVGPLMVADPTGTFVLERNWNARVLCLPDMHGALALVAEYSPMPTQASPTVPTADPAPMQGAPDPITLALYLRRFDAISSEMGKVLERTAMSTNIRDRHDFSCAVFDERGQLIANAPHIPVHLGAMSQSVRAVAEAHPHAQAGDFFATNDPAAGGSHLPDITVVSPVFDQAGTRRFYVASRGHHADVGGLTPGSMPPHSSSLSEEGIVLRALSIVQAGQWRGEALARVLAQGPFPCRRPDEVIADLRAQVAANRRGESLLQRLMSARGAAEPGHYAQHIQRHAALCVRATIAAMPDGSYAFDDALDDATPMRVQLEVRGEDLCVDLRGCGDQHPTNLNAPRAVTHAALLYVLRLWVGRPIPLNAGCLDAVDLRLREGSILDPRPDAAVVAGNVETSQRLVDILLGALGLAAASQGTMNNLSFGTKTWGYYETLGGGAGASATREGASAVHTHMTNTRLTDPEELESRFPVRLIRSEIRRGSGGSGTHGGGDGLIREYEFLAPMEVSLLAQRRTRAPFGLAGGGPGEAGRQFLDGEAVAANRSFAVQSGQRLRIETPGGGAYGADEAAVFETPS